MGRALIKETQIKMETAEIRNKERKCIETREIEDKGETARDRRGWRRTHTHTQR